MYRELEERPVVLESVDLLARGVMLVHQVHKVSQEILVVQVQQEPLDLWEHLDLEVTQVQLVHQVHLVSLVFKGLQVPQVQVDRQVLLALLEQLVPRDQQVLKEQKETQDIRDKQEPLDLWDLQDRQARKEFKVPEVVREQEEPLEVLD